MIESSLTGYAFVTRLTDRGEYDSVVLTFVEGYPSFQRWIDEAPAAPIPTGQWMNLGDQKIYDATTQANTFITFFPAQGQVMHYAYKVPDYAWKGWHWMVEDQVQHVSGSGRRPSLIQKLQTWKMWTKKAGAKF